MRLLLTMFVFAIPLLSSADLIGEGKATTKAKSDACKTCDVMKEQEDWFYKKRFLVPKQRLEAIEATEKVLITSQRLNEESRGKRGKHYYQEFEALVGLVAASLPFDMETQSAGDIAFILEGNDARSEAIYTRALDQVRDKCRHEFLKNVVSERRCNLKFDKSKGKEDERTKTCPVIPFNYEDCEAKQKSKS